MDVRATNDMSIVLNFQMEASLEMLMEEGGFEEFAKLAQEKLLQQLEPLKRLAKLYEVPAAPQNGEPKK